MIPKDSIAVKVDAPSRGLVTRIPSDQPPKANMKGGWAEALNMRFDDGVARNAPGAKDIFEHCVFESDITLIFQEALLSGEFPSFNNPIIGTKGELYVVRRGLYVLGTLVPCGIDSGEAFGNPTVQIYATSLYPLGIASGEAFGTPGISVPGNSLLFPTGIFEEAFGTPVLGLELAPSAIASDETFGSPTVTNP